MAIDVAKQFNGTVINADSQQVYKELRIVSARPSVKDENTVPHRLFGVLNGAQVCSAGQWVDMAVEQVNQSLDQGRLPILVGGTGMYIKSLTEGLSPIPEIPDHVRQRAVARREELGAEEFWDEVAHLDPSAAQRLPVGDSQRLIRAWEVSIYTNRSFSSWWDEPAIMPLPNVRFATIAIKPPRDQLYATIDARFAQMVENGAIDEIKALADLNLAADLPVMKALGVPELMSFVHGECTLDDAITKAQKLSRNYAKRQLTWVRNQIKGAYELDAQYSKRFSDEIFSFIHRF